ncbi:MAG: YdeI/OmpD-associated family protein [Cellulomonas sp.]
MPEDLPIVSFASRAELRRWLDVNHSTSTGIWVRLAKKGSGIPSVDFREVLEEGLCFGWSESNRRAGDAVTYLQRFTPRRVRGTTSERNHHLADRLEVEGLMTESGRQALARFRGAAPAPGPDQSIAVLPS